MFSKQWGDLGNKYLKNNRNQSKDKPLYLSRASVLYPLIVSLILIVYVPLCLPELHYDEDLFVDRSSLSEYDNHDHVFQDSTWYFAYYGISNRESFEFKTLPPQVLKLLLQTPSLTVNPHELMDLTDRIKVFQEAVIVYSLVDWIYRTDIDSIRVYLSYYPPLKNTILNLSRVDFDDYVNLMDRIDIGSNDGFYPMVNKALLERDKVQLIELIRRRITHIESYKDLFLRFKLMNSHVLYKHIDVHGLVKLKSDNILQQGSFQETLGEGLRRLNDKLNER